MPTFTLSDLRAKVLGRVDNNTALYSIPEVDYVINECIRSIALVTGFFRNTVHLPSFTVADQRIYNTPPGMLVPTLVSFEGRTLQKVGFKKLVRLRRNWATDRTATRGQVEFWAPIGIGKFVMDPIDSTGGHDLTLTGICEPPRMVNATDTMVLENDYVESITQYGEHRLPLKEGGKVFADGSLALNEFYTMLRERARYETFKAPRYRLLNSPTSPAQQAAQQ